MVRSFPAGKYKAAAFCLVAASLVSHSQADLLPLNETSSILSGSSSILNGLVTASEAINKSPVDALQSCLQSLSPVFPNSQNYKQDSAPFNQAFSWKPAAIVYPQNTNEVAQAVKCAASSGYKVSARAGGHSYAAFGLGGEE
jgi:hypothetical protein